MIERLVANKTRLADLNRQLESAKAQRRAEWEAGQARKKADRQAAPGKLAAMPTPTPSGNPPGASATLPRRSRGAT